MSALIGPGIGAFGSILGGVLGGGARGETKRERQSRKTADELLASLRGDGPFSDIFQRSESAFNKSIVEPSLSRFRNQIAPQIQQAYGASGMSRGTPMDDALLRAGVDLNQNINQLYLPYLQGGQQNALSALQSIIGQNAGAPAQPSFGQNLGNAAAGYFSSEAWSNSLKDIGKYLNSSSGSLTGASGNAAATIQPRGYFSDVGAQR